METALIFLVIFAAINLLVIAMPRRFKPTENSAKPSEEKGSQWAGRRGAYQARSRCEEASHRRPTYVDRLLGRCPGPLVLKGMHTNAERKQSAPDIERDASVTVKRDAGSD
jgi:hypothetical protein